MSRPMRIVWRGRPVANDEAADQREAVAFIDKYTEPGTLAAFNLLLRLLKSHPAEVQATLQRYLIQHRLWLEIQVAKHLVSEALHKEGQAELKALGEAAAGVSYAAQAGTFALQAAGTSVAAIAPVIGMIKEIVTWFVRADAACKLEGDCSGPGLRLAGAPIFSGWRNGGYWFFDLPVLSLTASIFETNFLNTPPYGSTWKPEADALVALCFAYPFGCPVPTVSVGRDGLCLPVEAPFPCYGAYDYDFTAGGKPWSVTVWSPADITPSGPRGFDPSAPLEWRAAGRRASVYDLPLPDKRVFRRGEDSVVAAGLDPSTARTVTTDEIGALPYRLDDEGWTLGSIDGPEQPPITQFSGYLAKDPSGRYWWVSTKPRSAPAAQKPAQLDLSSPYPGRPSRSGSGAGPLLVGAAVLGALLLFTAGD